MARNNQIFANSIATKKKLTLAQQKEIRKLYKDWAEELDDVIRYYEHHPAPSSIVKARQMKELQKMLMNTNRNVSNALYNNIKSNAFIMVDVVDKDHINWLKSLGFLNPSSIRLSNVEHRVVASILNGNVYKNGWNFSKAIWGDSQKTMKDISTFLARGVAENKPVYEVAKDIERYVNPAKVKPWNKRIVFKSDVPKKGFIFNAKTGKYEQMKRLYKAKVDYNAQRLARTIVQHSYQQALVESTKDNPFIEYYIWNASGSRPCPLCQDRDGMAYKKHQLPLDHPNGQCTIDVDVSPNLERDLNSWLNSPEGTYPEIDKFSEQFS